MGKIILGKERCLGFFQTLRMRLLSLVTSGQARPYISGVQLGKGGGGPRSGAEAGFVEQVGVGLKRQGDKAPPPRLHRGPGE